MHYEIVPAKEADAWVAEAIDYDSEGEIYSVLFYGHSAKRRAEEYVEWKNATA